MPSQFFNLTFNESLHANFQPRLASLHANFQPPLASLQANFKPLASLSVNLHHAPFACKCLRACPRAQICLQTFANFQPLSQVFAQTFNLTSQVCANFQPPLARLLPNFQPRLAVCMQTFSPASQVCTQTFNPTCRITLKLGYIFALKNYLNKELTIRQEIA